MADTPPVVPGHALTRPLGAGGLLFASSSPAGDEETVELTDPVSRPLVVALALAAREQAAQRYVSSEHLLRLREVVQLDGGVVALVRDPAGAGSLEELVERRGPLEPGEVTTVLTPLATTLAELDAAGVVHGALHPSRVLFTDHGKPVLTGFEAVRLVGEQHRPSRREPSGYDAPELGSGALPTPASDAWSLGAIGWYALTGHPPPADAVAQAPRVLGAELAAALGPLLEPDPALRTRVAVSAGRIYRAATAIPVGLGASAPDLPGAAATGPSGDTAGTEGTAGTVGAVGDAGADGAGDTGVPGSGPNGSKDPTVPVPVPVPVVGAGRPAPPGAAGTADLAAPEAPAPPEPDAPAAAAELAAPAAPAERVVAPEPAAVVDPVVDLWAEHAYARPAWGVDPREDEAGVGRTLVRTAPTSDDRSARSPLRADVGTRPAWRDPDGPPGDGADHQPGPPRPGLSTGWRVAVLALAAVVFVGVFLVLLARRPSPVDPGASSVPSTAAVTVVGADPLDQGTASPAEILQGLVDARAAAITTRDVTRLDRAEVDTSAAYRGDAALIARLRSAAQSYERLRFVVGDVVLRSRSDTRMELTAVVSRDGYTLVGEGGSRTPQAGSVGAPYDYRLSRTPAGWRLTAITSPSPSTGASPGPTAGTSAS